jgi:hypothetical protein
MSLSQTFPTVRPTLLLDFANAQALDPRITFTRNSPAVYYDGETTAVAEQNLLLQSQTFAVSPWVSLRMAPIGTSAGTAPDGTNTATKIIANTTNNYHGVYQVVNTSSTTYTFSVFAKSAEYTKLCLSDLNTNRFVATFDLTAGTVLSTSGSRLISAAASLNATTGWVRCSVTIAVISDNIYFSMVGYPDAGATIAAFGATYAGNDTSGILVWGAQVEQRSSATAYTATTTEPITNYQPVLLTAPANTARFDHNPVTGESLGLLIEETRTNLFTNSEFPNGVTNAPIRGGFVTATTFYGLTTTPGTGLAIGWDGVTSTFAYKSFAVAATTSYAISAYIKMTDGGIPVFGSASASSPANDFVFVVGSNTVSTTTYTITAVGNGVYRVSGVITTAVSPGSNCGIVKYNTNSSRTFTTSGYQLELGSFATSYIATAATQQTREADLALMTGTNFSSWHNNNQGTWYVAYRERAFSLTHQMIYSVVTGDTANRIGVAVNSSNTLDVQVVASGTDTFGGNTPTLTAQNYQIAFAYATDNAGVSANGSSVTTDTGVVLPLGVNRLAIGSTTGNAQHVNSTIAKIAYYDERLVNAQLQALTQG